MEREFIMLKPDCVQRNLIGEVISRIERSGLKILAMKFIQVSDGQAKQHYEEHEGKPFYNGLVKYIVSGPTVAMVVEGPNAVSITRKLVGATHPKDAAPGTVRGDFGLDIGRNLIHASDSPDNAEKEIKVYFSEDEMVSWDPVRQPWVVE
jgi:nucleoside-diphosphate kinase